MLPWGAAGPSPTPDFLPPRETSPARDAMAAESTQVTTSQSQPALQDAKRWVNGEEVVPCHSGPCTWSSVRLPMESKLGCAVPMADEVTSYVALHVCVCQHWTAPCSSLPCDGKTLTNTWWEVPWSPRRTSR